MNVLTGTKLDSVFDGKETTTIYDRVEDTKEEERLLHIVNDTPLKFETTVSKMLTNTTELSMQVNEVFKPMFADWHGCEIIPDNNGNLIVNFVFKAINNGDKETRAFVPINQTQEKTSNRTFDKIMSINLMNSSKNHTMDFTSYGAELIYDVLMNHIRKEIKPNKSAKINTSVLLNKYTAEVAENVGYGGVIQNIYCTVTGIDIYKVLGIVFGVKDNNSQIIYNAKAIRPVAPGMVSARANYIVEVEQMTESKYNAAMLKMGMYPMPGAISAVTGTISESRR